MTEDVDGPWAAYARVQEKLARRLEVEPYTWGLEAALNRLVLGEPLTEAEISRVIASESRKERHRANLRRVYPELQGSTWPRATEDALEVKKVLRDLRDHVTEDDWSLVTAISHGQHYSDIAAARGAKPGALRARMCRLRRKLRPAAAVAMSRTTRF